jgi:hypothetical protein
VLGHDGGQLVRKLFACALAKTSASLNLVTMAEPFKTRFELHYRNDLEETPDAPGAHETVARLADAYGERRTRDGRMIYAELWDRS